MILDYWEMDRDVAGGLKAGRAQKRTELAMFTLFPSLMIKINWAARLRCCIQVFSHEETSSEKPSQWHMSFLYWRPWLIAIIVCNNRKLVVRYILIIKEEARALVTLKGRHWICFFINSGAESKKNPLKAYVRINVVPFLTFLSRWFSSGSDLVVRYTNDQLARVSWHIQFLLITWRRSP